MTDKKANKDEMQPRSPVVAVVGHVDHGKTTLLDFIRKANVADKEAGGITQSIGAYEIEHDNKKITFIDTPGHSAFGAMRSRGASIADIAILVIAATEGIKPQTQESIDILKKTNTPFVVAITKIDAPSANIEKIKNELMSAEVLLEGSGGDISWQGVSGKTGEGIDELLNLILLIAEVSELKFDPKAHANGFVLEAKKSKQRGVIANIILKNGVLKKGDEIVTQSATGKIKILENFLGKPIKEILPSSPATVGSFDELPQSGDEFWADAVDIEMVGVIGGETPNELTQAIHIKSEEEEKGSINAVLKADSVGSLEALKQVLDVLVEIKEASVGEVTDSDIQFAKSTGSIVIGFGVKVGKPAERLADAQGTKIITSDIIYKLVEAIEAIDTAKDEAEKGGALEVLAVFSGTAGKQTIGGKVTEGVINLGGRVEIERGDEVVGKGKIKSLQKDKVEAKEVEEGSQCGLVLETETKIEKGDLLKAK